MSPALLSSQLQGPGCPWLTLPEFFQLQLSLRGHEIQALRAHEIQASASDPLTARHKAAPEQLVIFSD